MSEPSYLVVGSGGREHALGWKLSRDAGSPVVHVAPGNDGICADASIRGACPDIDVDDFDGLADFAQTRGVDVTVVGPEGPLCAGLADVFRDRGLAVLGPGRRGARLEASKSFAKSVMADAGVATAEAAVFDQVEPARTHVRRVAHPVAIKADGLAGGKGVVLSDGLSTSLATIDRYMVDAAFGDASRRVVIEECLEGTEMSVMIVTDGHAAVCLPTSQDHKRKGEGATGPNTGGMGAVAPAAAASDALLSQITADIVEPTLAELRRRQIEYCGFLYAGLMLTDSGPKVLEFNCRLGDPETQALMMGIQADVGPVLARAARGQLDANQTCVASADNACCVVLASRGYPRTADTGRVISGLDAAAELPDTTVFHAGTKRLPDGRFVTAGGRVLGVTSRGGTPQQARRRAYRAADRIEWDGLFYRRDIGVVR